MVTDTGMMRLEIEGLATAIQLEHEAASTAARSALEHALEAGRLLTKAREGIQHGGWESFVRDRCGIAPRTARLYVRLDANRERLANRQHVAGLTVREAARALAEPKAATVEGDRVDHLGQHWLELTPTAAVWNPQWPLSERPSSVAAIKLPAPCLPEWYSPRRWHFGEHRSGWSFEVSPDPFTDGRVHAVVHDPCATLHLASFDGMSPHSLMAFLTSCEQRHAVPVQGDGWTITTLTEHAAVGQMSAPFPYRIFHLAMRSGHRAYCWALIDEAIGLAERGDDPGRRAWAMFGRALATIAKDATEVRQTREKRSSVTCRTTDSRQVR